MIVLDQYQGSKISEEKKKNPNKLQFKDLFSLRMCGECWIAVVNIEITQSKLWITLPTFEEQIQINEDSTGAVCW